MTEAKAKGWRMTAVDALYCVAVVVALWAVALCLGGCAATEAGRSSAPATVDGKNGRNMVQLDLGDLDLKDLTPEAAAALKVPLVSIVQTNSTTGSSAPSSTSTGQTATNTTDLKPAVTLPVK